MKTCKIKDIGYIGTGTTPSMKNKEFYDSDDIMFIKPSDFIDNKITNLSTSGAYISNKAREKARIFPAGTVLCTCIGNIGKIAIVEKEASCNQQNNYIIPYKEFDSKYVAYSLLSQRKNMEAIGANAPIVPIINKTEFSNVEIPIYDSSTQIKIAHHLDTIQSAIDNKQKQLSKLDELVKSRFIEMFGDPIRNTKNFSTKKVIEVVTLQRGYDLPVQDRDLTGNIPVFGSNGILGSHSIAKINKGIITGRSGTIGEVYMCDKPFWPLNTTLFSNDTHGNNLCYLKYLLEFFDLKRFKSGVGVPTLNRNEFHGEQIIDVSLELQNSFSDFVQQIDKSKFVVKQQIKDLQELMDSKMQEYFGE